MKINEVEAISGISKKNIRFYEECGLLQPGRNAQNGYRDYSQEDVEILRRIKVLRKLGVPIEEIRQMFCGSHTVSDGMGRHLVSLERERRNLEQSIALCQQLKQLDVPARELNAGEILAQMEALEKGGASFRNRQTQDIRVRYIAPVTVAVMMLAIMAGLCGLVLWAYRTEPEAAPPVWFLLLVMGILAAVGIGVLLALSQRIQEIGKGEIDDARRY